MWNNASNILAHDTILEFVQKCNFQSINVKHLKVQENEMSKQL